MVMEHHHHHTPPPPPHPSSSSSSSSPSTSSCSAPVRVLLRHPQASSSSQSQSESQQLVQPSLPVPPPPRTSKDGIVVVGIIICSGGGDPEDAITQFLNRLLDSNIFASSGNQLHQNLYNVIIRSQEEEQKEEEFEAVADWFKYRRIMYCFDEERGIVFLCFSTSGSISLDDLEFEKKESDDLRGLLFMFLVCHVIMFLHEGPHFDTNMLKKFRLLQSAKHAIGPFVKSQIIPLPVSKSPATSLSSFNASANQASTYAKANSKPPIRGGVAGARSSTSAGLKSGSYQSLFPGQCTPVVLFIFIDDFVEGAHVTSFSEHQLDESALASQSTSALPKVKASSNSSSSVVMLSRPVSRSDGDLSKKLQSSLEGQIRIMIKKCRILGGSNGVEGSHTGSGVVSRAVAGIGLGSNNGSLFSLDASRAVALLDHSGNVKGESLNFVTALIDNVLDGKASMDVFHKESNNLNGTKEDIQLIRDFIFRQCDILRGRGSLAANSGGGSAAGIGMVAFAAAAAAAASASSGGSNSSGGGGKLLVSPPELPSLESWNSASQLLLLSLLSITPDSNAKENFGMDSNISGTTEKKSAQKKKGKVDPLESAILCLQSGRGINLKFSTNWCQKALPVAKQAYLEGLPPCYPTAVHEEHLSRALQMFLSMVKGASVEEFSERLKSECLSIWKSGRQLCDAVSLTGQPCMHLAHKVDKDQSFLKKTNAVEVGAEAAIDVSLKRHSSGYIFLHACACGRSRRIRDDPFNFDSANVTFNYFPDCENTLPCLKLPEKENFGPVKASAWSLVRLGSSSYYEPSKGLIFSGFCSSHKFLLNWTTSLENKKPRNSNPDGVLQKASSYASAGSQLKVNGPAYGATNQLVSLENPKQVSDSILPKVQKISFGRGLPVPEIKKSQSEGFAGPFDSDSAFPPLQQKKQPTLDKNVKKSSEKIVKNLINISSQSISKQGESSIKENSYRMAITGQTKSSPLLQIGSNVVPVILTESEKVQPSDSMKNITVYFGFEHECPCGHRFLLSKEHLEGLSPIASSPKDVKEPYLVNPVSQSLGGMKEGNFPRQDKGQSLPTRSNHAAGNSNSARRSKEKFSDNNQQKEQHHSVKGRLLTDNLERQLQGVSLDDSNGVSLLNMNLPIYLNCPQCRKSETKKQGEVKFAGPISQLQRIFMVTPPFPTVLATCPVVEFEASAVPDSAHDRESQSRFSLGHQVTLPPESFVSLRLPFVYGVELENSSHYALQPLKDRPETTAWIRKGTVLQVSFKGGDS